MAETRLLLRTLRALRAACIIGCPFFSERQSGVLRQHSLNMSFSETMGKRPLAPNDNAESMYGRIGAGCVDSSCELTDKIVSFVLQANPSRHISLSLRVIFHVPHHS